MLTYNDLKKGVMFVLDGEPYEVLEYEFLRMQQRKPVAKTKIKSLVSGKVVERNFHYSDSFEEADILKETVKFLYNHRGEFWFSRPAEAGRGSRLASESERAPSKGAADRFSLKEDVIGEPARFLRPNTDVTAVRFRDKIINIEMPIKIDLKVKEAPPGIRGDTAQGGTKAATLETGATINVPLFVNTGDIVRVNTETGTYAERVEKGKG